MGMNLYLYCPRHPKKKHIISFCEDIGPCWPKCQEFNRGTKCKRRLKPVPGPKPKGFEPSYVEMN